MHKSFMHDLSSTGLLFFLQNFTCFGLAGRHAMGGSELAGFGARRSELRPVCYAMCAVPIEV